MSIAVCLPAIAVAATTVPATGERALREECSAFSQAGMRDCLREKVESSQKALTQAEQKMIGALSKWDEDDRYIREAKTKLVASNKKFAEYRETQCEFSASLTGGGAGDAHDIRRLACVSELNNRRAEQLGNAASDLPLK
ncbi:lysozyme inhibitor LprI family protein [Paraburkholderia sp. ZP32-5]|uniref:lysozyme inhibitor LprI family protein n=1 Tax=Paraburkholderia sp. ZP32-5 TaxID=2883245 RepID=UPI001F429FA9|nr:lysozyme inhibitor LprI family protein [Paraburkholderia sp. ZP32-5]